MSAQGGFIFLVAVFPALIVIIVVLIAVGFCRYNQKCRKFGSGLTITPERDLDVPYMAQEAVEDELMEEAELLDDSEMIVVPIVIQPEPDEVVLVTEEQQPPKESVTRTIPIGSVRATEF